MIGLGLAWSLATGSGGFVAQVRAQAPDQEPGGDERLQVLTNPANVRDRLELEQKREKDKTRPPLEFFRSQVAPFDILPMAKPNHWSTMSLEMRSNYEAYQGLLQTEPVPLKNMPHRVIFRRDAQLLMGERTRIGLQMLLPLIPRELNIELIRPEGVRPDESWKASLRTLAPWQTLVVVLSRSATDAYAPWGRFQAVTPLSIDLSDTVSVERQRYYRMVLPLEPERPPLSSHPLTWTTISHVLWDGLPPDVLTASQQQALIDWLHFGGQLIVTGGATPGFSLLRDSFLEPYLPADPTGQGELLDENALGGLSAAYPPPIRPAESSDEVAVALSEDEARERSGRRYEPAVPIRPAPGRPLYVAGLKPRGGVGHPTRPHERPDPGRRVARRPRARPGPFGQPDRRIARLMARSRYPGATRGTETPRGATGTFWLGRLREFSFSLVPAAWKPVTELVPAPEP